MSDGSVSLNNSSVDRTIQPIALTRNNTLLASHVANANWLTDALIAIVNDHKQSHIDQLLRWDHTDKV